MSPGLASARAYAADESMAEPLTRQQFAIALDLQYRISMRRRVLYKGRAKTSHLSAKEILLHSERPLPAGRRVELSIDWPMPLDGTCPLQLRVAGKITYSSGTKTVVRILRHQFCTSRKLSAGAATTHGNGS